MGKLKILTTLLLAAALTGCGDDSDVFYSTSYPVARIEVSVSLTAPEKPDPEDPDPENPDPETPDPENPDPENPDPENPDPENPDPENPDPENPDPQNPGTGTSAKGVSAAETSARGILTTELLAAGMSARGVAAAGISAARTLATDTSITGISTTRVSTTDDPGTPEEPVEPENPLLQEIRDDVLAKAPVQAGGSYRLDFTHHNGGPLVVRPAADAQTVTGTFVKEPDKPEALHFAFGEHAYTCTVSAYTDTDNVRRTLLSIDLTEQYQQLYPDAGITQVVRQEYTSRPY